MIAPSWDLLSDVRSSGVSGIFGVECDLPEMNVVYSSR